MHRLRVELEEHNPGLQLAAMPRYLVAPNRREGKAFTSAVIALTNSNISEKLCTHGVLLAGKHRKVTEYLSIRPGEQCTQCQGFGHLARNCSNPPACRLCAGEHKTRDHQCTACDAKGKLCEHTHLRCKNCGGGHRASYPECTLHFRAKMRAEREQEARGSQPIGQGADREREPEAAEPADPSKQTEDEQMGDNNV